MPAGAGAPCLDGLIDPPCRVVIGIAASVNTSNGSTEDIDTVLPGIVDNVSKWPAVDPF